MQGKSPDQSELNLFEPVLMQITDHGHPLRVLADSIPWGEIETEYSVLYSDRGAPAKPVRMMAGLLLLKQIFKGSDEGVVAEWSRDPYFQYLCGGNVFTGKQPCDPSDLARFRKRIGPERLKRLLGYQTDLHRKAGLGKIKVKDNSRPGQVDFSYSAGETFFSILVKGFRKMAGRFSGVYSGTL